MKKNVLLAFVLVLFSTAVVVVFVSPLMSHWIHPTQHSEPFPIIWIVAAIVIVVLVAVALLVYFVKVKKTKRMGKSNNTRVSHMDINTCIRYTYSCHSRLQTKTTQNTIEISLAESAG